MDDHLPREATLRLAVPRPPAGERRVPLDPETVGRFSHRGWSVTIERGAGASAGFPDAAYAARGATIVESKTDLLGADILLVSRLPGGPNPSARHSNGGAVPAEPDGATWLELLRRVPTIVGLLSPLDHPDHVRAWMEQGQTAFSLDIMPRASRALMADAGSSQGSLAGYRGTMLAIAQLDRTIPLMVLPAGSLPPARFLIVGSGPIGLQAAITAHRLGAIVELYDPRAAEREVVESIGVTFIGGDIVTDGGEHPSRTEAARRQKALLAQHTRHADAVVLAAIMPGHPSPKLISREAVEGMRPGSVIVDLAAPWGGNCELTRPGETVQHGEVTILGPLNPVSDLAHQASSLLAHNVEYFLNLLAANGSVPLRIEDADPVVQAACVVDHGEVRYRPSRTRLGLDPLPVTPTDESLQPAPDDMTAAEDDIEAATEPATAGPSGRRQGGLFGSLTRFGLGRKDSGPTPDTITPTGASATASQPAGVEAAPVPEAEATPPSAEATAPAGEATPPSAESPSVAAPASAASASAPADHPGTTDVPRTSEAAEHVGDHALAYDSVMADADHAEAAQRDAAFAWAERAAPDDLPSGQTFTDEATTLPPDETAEPDLMLTGPTSAVGDRTIVVSATGAHADTATTAGSGEVIGGSEPPEMQATRPHEDTAEPSTPGISADDEPISLADAWEAAEDTESERAAPEPVLSSSTFEDVAVFEDIFEDQEPIVAERAETAPEAARVSQHETDAEGVLEADEAEPTRSGEGEDLTARDAAAEAIDAIPGEHAAPGAEPSVSIASPEDAADEPVGAGYQHQEIAEPTAFPAATPPGPAQTGAREIETGDLAAGEWPVGASSASGLTEPAAEPEVPEPAVEREEFAAAIASATPPATEESPVGFVPERDDATGTYEPMPPDDLIDDTIPPVALDDGDGEDLDGPSAHPAAPASEPAATDLSTRPPGWGRWGFTPPPAATAPSSSVSPPEDEAAPASESPGEPADATSEPPAGARARWVPLLNRPAETTPSVEPAAAADIELDAEADVETGVPEESPLDTAPSESGAEQMGLIPPNAAPADVPPTARADIPPTAPADVPPAAPADATTPAAPADVTAPAPPADATQHRTQADQHGPARVPRWSPRRLLDRNRRIR